MADQKNVRKVIEDYALETVPESQRKSGWQLMWMTAGLVTTLVQLLIGSYVTALAGVAYGVLAGILVGVFGGTLGWLVGRISLAEGLSSTVLSRFYGFGARGSFVTSAIYSFMILGFLALENSLLYNGTTFALGLQDTLGMRVLVYGLLSLAWIYLSAYGVKQVLRVSSVLTIAFLALLAYVVWRGAMASGEPLGDILAHGAMISGIGSNATDRLYAALVALAGSAGALALSDADYARYARTSKDVAILAFAGAFAIDVLMVVAGTIIIYGGNNQVAQYLLQHHSPGQQAAYSANQLAGENTGAYFVIFAGIAGFVLMYLAQAKAQVLNTYSGSLSLSNFFDAVFRWRPGRLAMVVLGNLMGLAMTAGGILHFLQAWLGMLGILTTSFVGVILSDYYVVRRGRRASRTDVEAYNAAGLAAIALASAVAYACQSHGVGILKLGFLVALVLSMGFYSALRLTVLKPGTLSGGRVPPSLALAERDE